MRFILAVFAGLLSLASSSNASVASESITSESITSESDNTTSSDPMAGYIALYDHLETEKSIPIGETERYLFIVSANLQGAEAWPLDLHVYVEYDYIGDAIREGYVMYAKSLDDLEDGVTTMLGSIPVEEGQGNVVTVEEGDTVYFDVSAVKPTTFNDLTVEFWVILRQAGTDSNLYGGSLDHSPNYIHVYDDTKTVWLDVTEGSYFTFEYNLDEDGERFFEVDLKTFEHDLVLFGRKDGLPTTDAYDWKSDRSAPITGTVMTSQIMSAGHWYLRVYGEDILFFTESATFRLTVSTTPDFNINSAPAGTVQMFLIALIALIAA